MKSIQIVLIYCLFLSFLFTKCKSPQPPSQIVKEDNKKVIRFKNSKVDEIAESFFDILWVHRYEHDKDGFLYFKPEVNSKFSQLYRNQLLFRKDGTCKYRWLAPNDAHKMKDAMWNYNPGRIFILENGIDIVDVYQLYSVSDTLLLLKKENMPFDKIYGKWKLIEIGSSNMSQLGYVIDLQGKEVTIRKGNESLGTYQMSHSPRRLQEPLALHFEVEISKKYPWLASGNYGVINDTLILEIAPSMESKFIRYKN